MNRLQKKVQSLPLAVQVLITGAFAFAVTPVILCVMQLVLEGRVKAGPWDLVAKAGEFALVMMALASANLLMQERRAWRGPLLIAAMAGCVLMLMGYSFALGLATGAEGVPKSMNAWNWFTLVFIFLVPVVGFVQAFRAHARPAKATLPER